MINPPKLNQGIGIAHSKVILLGEHAVVHGKPAIALPFPSLKATVTVKEWTNGFLINGMGYSGPIEKIPPKMEGLAECVFATLQALEQKPKGLYLDIHSEIPIGRGLGSSAAIAIAIVRSLFNFYKCDLDYDQLMQLVTIAERVAHGNPSGIDMKAASSDTPIWFQKNKPVDKVEMNSSFYLIVADSGRIGETREAVESIIEKLNSHPIETQASIDSIEKFTLQAKKALAEGDLILLGNLLSSTHIELDKLGVSDEGLNRLVDTAKRAGALGAKLTGGGRGGCIIAMASHLSQVQKICQALIKNGAEDTWFYKVDQYPS